MELEVETDVAAPPDAVFAILADVERWPSFLASADRVEMLTPGPLQRGSRFRETRTIFGRTATEEMTVAVLTPPHRFDLAAENHGTRYRVQHEIVAQGSGARLRLVFESTAITFAAKLGSALAVLFRGAVRKQLEADLAGIKAEAERRARG